MAIIYEKKDRIAYLTINRPEAMNTIDTSTFKQMLDAVADFKDDPENWIMILTGAGDKSFSTGFDIKSLTADVTGGSIDMPRINWFKDIYKPVIAAINGYCFAGALEIVLSTDIRIASENAVFGLTEAKWGVSPCDGAITNLVRQVNWCHAMQLLLMAEPVNAEDAYRMGLVNMVVPFTDLSATADKIAQKIAGNAPLAVRNEKEVGMRALGMSLDQALSLEHAMGLRIMGTEDAREGPRAFAEKRKPQYRAR